MKSFPSTLKCIHYLVCHHQLHHANVSHSLLWSDHVFTGSYNCRILLLKPGSVWLHGESTVTGRVADQTSWWFQPIRKILVKFLSHPIADHRVRIHSRTCRGMSSKNISQIGNLPQIGVKIKNIWNHHPVYTISDFGVGGGFLTARFRMALVPWVMIEES